MADDNSFARWEKLAAQCGFTHAWPLDAHALVFRDDVRRLCAEDRCRCYGRSWICPPACGSVGDARLRAGKYSRGILVQSVRRLDGPFDLEGINAAENAHNRSFDLLHRKLKALHPGLFAMGMGGCRRCGKCTYPDAPCRKPDEAVPSMEAYGLMVSDVCAACGAKYGYGEGTVTFTSCFLLE
jgi:predicted metal-binding protein